MVRGEELDQALDEDDDLGERLLQVVKDAKPLVNEAIQKLKDKSMLGNLVAVPLKALSAAIGHLLQHEVPVREGLRGSGDAEDDSEGPSAAALCNARNRLKTDTSAWPAPLQRFQRYLCSLLDRLARQDEASSSEAEEAGVLLGLDDEQWLKTSVAEDQAPVGRAGLAGGVEGQRAFKTDADWHDFLIDSVRGIAKPRGMRASRFNNSKKRWKDRRYEGCVMCEFWFDYGPDPNAHRKAGHRYVVLHLHFAGRWEAFKHHARLGVPYSENPALQQVTGLNVSHSAAFFCGIPRYAVERLLGSDVFKEGQAYHPVENLRTEPWGWQWDRNIITSGDALVAACTPLARALEDGRFLPVELVSRLPLLRALEGHGDLRLETREGYTADDAQGQRSLQEDGDTKPDGDAKSDREEVARDVVKAAVRAVMDLCRDLVQVKPASATDGEGMRQEESTSVPSKRPRVE